MRGEGGQKTFKPLASEFFYIAIAIYIYSYSQTQHSSPCITRVQVYCQSIYNLTTNIRNKVMRSLGAYVPLLNKVEPLNITSVCLITVSVCLILLYVFNYCLGHPVVKPGTYIVLRVIRAQLKNSSP